MIVEFWGHEFKVNIVLACMGGLVIALISSMFGFGGGPFMSPFMAVILGLPMYVVVGSSLLAIAFNTFTASIRHYQFGNFDVLLFAIMFPAAIMGGFIAPQIAKRVSPLVVKRVAVAGLLILATRLLGLW
ncbi:MAG: hypothetical protein CVV37_03855 [Nitrospira bacterium HGW-Nitrospira-1]|nr:MAG: hypothetical protein CVV37_03855 [Nitrospira bacterium HGW-Nitrospira-1]